MNHRFLPSSSRLLRAAFVAAVLATAACSPPTAEQLLADAEKAIAAGDEQAARIHLMNLLQREEDNVAAQVRLAELDLDAGQAPAAELGFRRAARLKPDDARVRAGLAQAMAQQGRMDEALKFLGTATTGAPADRVRLLAVRGALLQQKGDLAGAREALQTAAALAPADAERIAALAQLEILAGQPMEGEWRVAQALSLDPDNVRGLLALGSLQVLRRQPTAAAITFQRAADIAERDRDRQLRVSALLALVEVQLLDTDTTAAERTIDTLNGIAPGVVQAQFLRAALAARRGEYEAATTELLAVLRETPASQPARRLLGLVYARTDKLNQAEDYLEKAATRFPQDEAVRDALAAVRAGQESTVVPGAWPEAAPPSPASLTELRQATEALGRGDVARAYRTVEAVAQREPRNAEAMNLLGGVRLASGFAAGAITPLESATRLDPKSPAYALNLARAYLAAGDPEAAAAAAARARALGAAGAALDELDFRLQLARGDVAAAGASLAKIAPEPRTTAAALWLVADLRQAEGNPGAAADALADAFTREPSRVLALRLAQVMQAAGRADPERPLREWVKAHGGDAEIAFARAGLARAAGDAAGSRRQLEAALAADPGFAPALNDLALAYLAEGDPRALDFAERAARARPDDPRVLDTLGWVRLGRGQSAPALEVLARAARLAPAEPEIQYHLAAALAEAGRPAEAGPILSALLARSTEFPARAEATALRDRLRAAPGIDGAAGSASAG